MLFKKCLEISASGR